MRDIKFIQQHGNISIVSTSDELRLVPARYTFGIKPGEEVKIPDDVLKQGIEYGIDWSIVFPKGLSIKSEEIKKSFYAQGIFTLEDLKRNPNIVMAAINSILKITAIEIIKKAKDALGGE
jgi:hypothetical protein